MHDNPVTPRKMEEIEITDLPALTDEQEAILDLHSVLNLMNVVAGELSIIQMNFLQFGEETDRHLSTIASIEDGLRAGRETMVHLRRFRDLAEPVLEMTQRQRASLSSQHQLVEFDDSVANLQSVFSVLRKRYAELEERVRHPEGWVRMPLAELQGNFAEVFAAIERNAKGRYWFRYNPARQRPSDYYVDLKFESELGDFFWMPPALQDVLRDLAANARKYTRPGGRIALAVYQDESSLSCLIEDTGRGIPPDELLDVVKFGYRASNAQDVHTLGAGFGLTKAVRLVKQWNGRFWIASMPGVGTRMRIHIPALPLPESTQVALGQN